MEQKFERKKENPVQVEFQALSSGLRESFSHPGWRTFFFLHKNQFLKLTNSCCFCTFDKDLQSGCVAHVCTRACVCGCVSRLGAAGVCVSECVCTPIIWAELLLWGSAHEGSAFQVCEPLVPRLLPSSLLGDCALNRFFFCPKSSLRSLLSLNFGEKRFPGAEGVLWSDNGSLQDQNKARTF